ncbi:MAG: hypothetical protein IPL65_12190 [Lewinellaceae bacterium]|nr:hypothetical protein [Lewinellaceae bacterium]
MNNTRQQLEHLAEIRALMERSSRFLSLSGLTGVWAGICALAGAAAVYYYLGVWPFSGDETYYEAAVQGGKWGLNYETAFILIGLITLLFALVGGVYFTSRKARKKGLKVWDHSSRRLLVALAIPLVAGGLFCLALMYLGLPGLVAPATLVFYGLALVHGGKFTLGDVEYLGMLEVVLGLCAMFFLGSGLEFWVFGFGVLHILYGIRMWFKYDR